MGETVKTPAENPALIEWKIKKVTSNMDAFQSKVYGRHKNLQVRTSNKENPNPEGTNSPSVTLEISTYNTDDRIGQYGSERISLSKSVDEIGKKFGAISNNNWEIKALEGSRYIEKTYEFRLPITRSDRFLYHSQRGNYGQAVLGLLVNR
ncbi:hypothetical protein CANDROIZ_110002 [Candidatus Roizmanbacteria bacterium]|nr:hypothetical protein CANDROIZ_110002 [Candidatus Roizmanbacteria bacterium]